MFKKLICFLYVNCYENTQPILPKLIFGECVGYIYQQNTFKEEASYISIKMPPICKKNPNYNAMSYSEIENCNVLTDEQLQKEFNKMKEWANKCDITKDCPNSFCGNKIVKHFTFPQLLKTRRGNKPTLQELWENEDTRKTLIDNAIKYNRRKKLDVLHPIDIYQINNLCAGSIVAFKPSVATYIYKKFGATKVLDPCAGWGGRMLGAWALNIRYVGIDTNRNLISPYLDFHDLSNLLGNNKVFPPKEEQQDKTEQAYRALHYGNCFEEDFSRYDYDFVLTSPPYLNVEVYEDMTPFDSEKQYYTQFLIPLIHKCLKDIKKDGKVCINVSDYIMNKAQSKYDLFAPRQDYRISMEAYEMPQQTGGKKNKEMLYVFTKSPR